MKHDVGAATRDQIAGFMLGISVGTAIGFFLRPETPEDEERRRIPGATTGERIADAGARQERQDVPSSLSRAIPGR